MKRYKNLCRVICAALVLVMLLSVIPFTAFAADALIKSTTVDIDMQVKKNKKTYDPNDAAWGRWSNGPVALEISDEFGFRTILDTTNIKLAARSWYDAGLQRIYKETESLPEGTRERVRAELIEKLESRPLTGTFTVTITIPQEIEASAEAYMGKNMNGFNDGAKTIFYEDDYGGGNRPIERYSNGYVKEITIVIHPKAPYGNPGDLLTLGELYYNRDTYLPELIFTSEGNTVMEYGPLTVVGTMDGYVEFLDYNENPVTVTFDGVQKPNTAASNEFVNPYPGEEDNISATLLSEKQSTPETPVISEEPDHDPGERKPTPTPHVVIASEQLNTVDHFCYIIGYPDGLVRPTQNITRDEVTTIFYRLLRVENRIKYATTQNPYTDVPVDRWSNKAISTMTNGKYVEGYPNGSFRPHAPITRAEFVTMATRFASLSAGTTNKFSDISGHWAYNYILKGYEAGWINGYPDGTFRPNAYITRAEVMTIINRMLGRKVDQEGLLPQAHYWPDMNGKEWYYFDVMEATNAHDYFRRSGLIEKWTAIDVNFVWVEKDEMEDPNE